MQKFGKEIAEKQLHHYRWSKSVLIIQKRLLYLITIEKFKEWKDGVVRHIYYSQ